MMRELLLCPPDHYGIEYEINPWMSRERGAEAALAQKTVVEAARHAVATEMQHQFDSATAEASRHGFHC